MKQFAIIKAENKNEYGMYYMYVPEWKEYYTYFNESFRIDFRVDLVDVSLKEFLRKNAKIVGEKEVEEIKRDRRLMSKDNPFKNCYRGGADGDVYYWIIEL